jgi:hypothetical protein
MVADADPTDAGHNLALGLTAVAPAVGGLDPWGVPAGHGRDPLRLLPLEGCRVGYTHWKAPPYHGAHAERTPV